MPDLERRPSASFISSKEGGTPLLERRSRISSKSSRCLGVSMRRARGRRRRTKHECSTLVLMPSQAAQRPSHYAGGDEKARFGNWRVKNATLKINNLVSVLATRAFEINETVLTLF